MSKYINPLFFHKFVFSCLIFAYSLCLFPILLYDIIRMATIIPLDYGEGWNVVHILRLLNGNPLYVPLTALPIAPVNYPPLSFFIVGGISYLTGSVLPTGRVVSLISLLVISYLIFRIISSLVLNKIAALLGMLLWLTLMVSVAEKYVGSYNPQMLAHVFSLVSLYIYIKFYDDMSYIKILLISLFCCTGIFIKHMLIPIPLSIALMFLISKRRFFLFFIFFCFIILSSMVFGTFLYGGNDFLSNFIELDRNVSYYKAIDDIISLFFRHSIWVIFLPFLMLMFVKPKGVWFVVLIYYSSAFVFGFYISRGIGVSRNAWFDFFIAASLAFGIYTAKISIMVRQKEQFALPFCHFFNYAATPLAAGMIISGILVNQFIIGHYISQDGIIESSTIATIQRIQAILIFGGMIMLIRRKIMIIVNRLLSRIGVKNSEAFWLQILIYGVLISSIFPFLTNLQIGLEHNLNYRMLKDREDVYRKDAEYLRSLPGPALIEDPLLSVASGKEFLFDPFLGSQMMIAGRIPEEILTKPIEEKYFAIIVLDFDLEKNLTGLDISKTRSLTPRTTLTQRWTDDTLIAITNNYELLALKHPYNRFFYIPRKIH